MIQLEHIDGRSCPFIVCDECGERIQSSADGNELHEMIGGW